MSNPIARAALGVETAAVRSHANLANVTTPLQSATRDFVFAEIWNRAGLDMRARYLIALSGTAITQTEDAVIDGYVEGAIDADALSLLELREAALHLGAYSGWANGERLDAAISRIIAKRGLTEPELLPLGHHDWAEGERHALGADEFFNVIAGPAPGPTNALFDGGILNFIFAELWVRPGLDQRGRRWITLVGACDSGSPTPTRSHIHAAMASGNCTEGELHEFALQFATYVGWPKASLLPNVIIDMAEHVRKGLSWHV